MPGSQPGVLGLFTTPAKLLNYNNLFKAKEIGEGLGISSRTASGAMRKLVTDGYIEKVGATPVVYSLTTLGVETDPMAE